MRPRPSLAASGLAVLALVHAWWGLKMLIASELLVAGSQLVSAGGLILAAAACGQRSTTGLSMGLGIAAVATFVRLAPIAAGGFGPFAAATLLLATALALAAYGARRVDGVGALALRGGGALLALSYLAFMGAGFALSGQLTVGDFLVRAIAAGVFAAFVDAPPLALLRAQRESPSAAATAASTSPLPRS